MKLVLDILELQIKSNKKVCIFETYTRYSWDADEEQKKGIKCFKCSFYLIVLFEETVAFLISLKGAIWKKSFGNPVLNYWSI